MDLTREVGEWGGELGIGPVKRTRMFMNVECSASTIVPHGHCTHIEGPQHLRLPGKSTSALAKQLPKVMAAARWSFPSNFHSTELLLLPPQLFAVIDATWNYPELRVIATDAVSLDPPRDGGALLAHRLLWSTRPGVLVVELTQPFDSLPLNTILKCRLDVLFFQDHLLDALPVVISILPE